MTMNLREQLALLPDFLGNHLLLTVVALAIGIGISLPLAILAARVRALQTPLLGLASVLQTVPSLALLALMVPLLGQIGFVPALIALVLYSLLPILRNTVTGIVGVSPALIEAARGVGMTPGQMLRRVQLPLAAPIIVAGIRTATVLTVGVATLATPVGATSLGNYIFSGLQLRNYTAVLVGCVAAAGLALLLDGLIRLMEIAAERRSRNLAVTAGLGLLLVLGGGLAPLVAQNARESAVAGRPGVRGSGRVVIGSKPFTEQYILADLLAKRLKDAGFHVEKKTNLGSNFAFDALDQGQIDAYVDYSGTIWANVMKRKDTPDARTVLREMTAYLKDRHGIVHLGPLGFENAYALAMKEAQADRLGVRTLDDLARVAPNLKIGSDYEFFQRPEWRKVRDAYNLQFARQVTLDPNLMYAAVNGGQVDVISAYSSDGRILADRLRVLDDPQNAFPPYDAVLLISKKAAVRPGFVEALKPLVGAIDDDTMRAANKLVDIDKRGVGEAAKRLEERMK